MRMAFGRAALVLAAGLLLLTTSPQGASSAPAADDTAVEPAADAGTQPTAAKTKNRRVHKASRTRKASKVASLKQAKPKARVAAPNIPEIVANANARMPTTDAQGTATAIDITPAPLEAAAAEQLSQLDKSLAAPLVDAPQQFAQLATDEPARFSPPTETAEPARPVTQVRSASNDAWAQSSLVGKIFIAFGGMLTLASAARMLIA